MEWVDYVRRSPAERRSWVEEVSAKLPPRFALSADSRDRLVARFDDHDTQSSFSLIPGGDYEMGFTDQEEQAARSMADPLPLNLWEMRPVRRIHVGGPLLVQQTPVLERSAARVLGSAVAKESRAAWLSHEEANRVAAAYGCRLLSEAEWEYCCRAGTRTLFTFGDSVPDDEVLARWLAHDFSDLSSVEANGFGLYGLFTGEWCRDEFRGTLAENAAVVTGSHVVRGGGAYFWPWQDEEWVWCMSAMRMPSKDLHDDRCAVRLAFELAQ